MSEMPGLTRDGLLGKWIWQMAEEDTLPLDEIAHELACQYQRFIDVFGREPTHLDSHHHVHMFPQIFPIVARFAAQRGIALRIDRQTVLNADDLPSVCAALKDLVVNFTARRSPKRAFYAFWMPRRIEEKPLWR